MLLSIYNSYSFANQE